MEQNRTLLIVLLCFVAYMMYEAWQKDYHPVQTVSSPSPTPGSAAIPGKEKSVNSGNALMPVPSGAKQNADTDLKAASTKSKTEIERGHRLTVQTDVYRAEIDTLGGDLAQVDLAKYPLHFNQKETPFRLFDTTALRHFVAQSGWYLPNDPDNHIVPGSRTVYKADKDSYRMEPSDNSLQVDLHWVNAQGVQFTKRYEFHRDSYIINVTHFVSNPGEKEFKANLYLRLERNAPKTNGGFFMLPTFTGPVYYSPDKKYQKIQFSHIDDVKDQSVKDAIQRDISGGWVAMIEQFFVGAWIPDDKINFKYFTSRTEEAEHLYMIGMVAEQAVPAKAQNVAETARLYVGPKIQNKLAAIAPGLELSVDYGWLTFISKPLFWALDHIERVIHNWGWAIILLTILVKGAFYKLSETSYRSMARMKSIGPRMAALKERFGDDKQKMNQAMMELYKKEKINPLGGCLPIVIQIPVFIALYYVLLESVELRQAPWILWIQDLSIMDPYFVLPILMGVTMLVQQKLNPAPADPLQAKIMMVLPLMFTVMFAVFPSGLVLYWVVSNLLSIAQQWYITKHVLSEEKHTAGHHAKKKGDE